MPATDTLLQVSDLSVEFHTDDQRLRAVDRVSFDIAPGRFLGLVGESGCGKTVTALSILGLLPRPAGKIVDGEINFEGRNLTALSPHALQKVRGSEIAMIFQEPMSALNPVFSIGRQVGEVFRIHSPQMSAAERKKRSIALLQEVGISSPEIRLGEYPHQLSGGMRQRVMIAMALALRPKLLIADEPTTALDVTVQAQILELLKKIQREHSMAILLITHDLGVVAQECEEVIVMYGGRIAERAPVNELYKRPRHPYTHGLLQSIPKLETPRQTTLPIIEGIVPSLEEMPSGCRFYDRCPHAIARCSEVPPPLETVSSEHTVSCYRWKELAS